MTSERLAQRLTQVLTEEADTVAVRGTWDDIAARLIEPDSTDHRPRPIASTRRRRALGALSGVVVVAAAIPLVVVLSWRPPTPTPAGPVAPVTTGVPAYDPSIPTLVVYRPTAGLVEPSGPAPVHASSPGRFAVAPERMRTASRDIGKAALEAMVRTPGVHPGHMNWLGQLQAQQVDIASVTVSGGLIRVELDGFSCPPFQGADAELLAQAWVRTLQDTLGVRHDVSIRLQGKPFRLYGSIDTAKPLTRDESVRIVRPDGFDSPRNDDVVPSNFVLLGTATAGPSRPAHVRVVDLDTGAIAYDWDVAVPTDDASPVDFMPIMTLEPGRYRATLASDGPAGIRDIRFTVVQA